MMKMGFEPKKSGFRTNTCPYAQRFSSVQSLSHVQLFATPYISARQASLSITNSRSSLKLTSVESVMPSPSLPAFSLSQHQSLFQWVSSLHQVAKVLKLQHFSCQWIFWFPKGLISFRIYWLISLQSKGLSRVFSNTAAQKHQLFSIQLSL